MAKAAAAAAVDAVAGPEGKICREIREARHTGAPFSLTIELGSPLLRQSEETDAYFMKRSLFPTVLLATHIPIAASADDCTNWLDPSFYANSTATEIVACLENGRTLSERTETGETPLHLAVSVAQPDIVLALLRAGADVTLKTTDLLTPLHVAARDTQHAAVISYLLLWGSDPDERASPDTCGIGVCAETSLHLAASRPGSAPVLAALLAGKADATNVDMEGRSPLHRAVARAGLEEIDVLLKGGAKIDGKDFSGNTALHLVHENERAQLAIAERLIAAGANVDAQRDDDVTPLISIAYYTSHPEVFALLLSHSEDPCHASKSETTALTGHDYNKALSRDEAYWSLHEKCSNQ